MNHYSFPSRKQVRHGKRLERDLYRFLKAFYSERHNFCDIGCVYLPKSHRTKRAVNMAPNVRFFLTFTITQVRKLIQECCLAPERGRNPPPSGGGGCQRTTRQVANQLAFFPVFAYVRPPAVDAGEWAFWRSKQEMQ